MDGVDINKVSDDLFNLIIQIQKKAFNHDELLKCMPMPPSHVKVIFYLAHHGSTSVSNIGKSLNISKPNMTPIIDSLIQDDMVIRSNDPTDRRKIKIELTDKGRELLHAQKKLIIRKFSVKLSTLSSEDINTFENSLNNLNSIISKL